MRLSQPAVTTNASPGADRPDRRLEQREGSAVTIPPCARRPRRGGRRWRRWSRRGCRNANQPAAKALEAGKRDRPLARRGDGPDAAPRGIVEVHAAAGIPHGRIAGGLERPPDGLAEDVRERTDLGDEGVPAAPESDRWSRGAGGSLVWVLPVDPEDIDLGVVPAPVEDVRLRDPVGRQRPPPRPARRRRDRSPTGSPRRRGRSPARSPVPSNESVRSWSVKPKVTPSARVMRQHHASVVVPSSRWPPAAQAGAPSSAGSRHAVVEVGDPARPVGWHLGDGGGRRPGKARLSVRGAAPHHQCSSLLRSRS